MPRDFVLCLVFGALGHIAMPNGPWWREIGAVAFYFCSAFYFWRLDGGHV